MENQQVEKLQKYHSQVSFPIVDLSTFTMQVLSLEDVSWCGGIETVNKDLDMWIEFNMN